MADTLLEKIKKIKSMETPIESGTGFKPASVYKGKSLMDTFKAFDKKTGMGAAEYLMNRGLPLVGSGGGEKSLEAINKVVDEADRFEKINPGVRQAEEMITGPAKTMKNKPVRTMITNVFEDVQSKADDMFGAAQDIAGDIAKQEDKLKFITKEVAEKLPKLAIGGIDLIKKIGFAMLFGGPSTMGADLIPESVLNDMAEDLGVKEKEPMTFAGGGMAIMDDMIKPIGYDVGGIVPKKKPEKELTYKQIVEMLKADKTSAKEPTGFYKYLADTYPVDPINKTIDELKALGVQLSKKGSK